MSNSAMPKYFIGTEDGVQFLDPVLGVPLEPGTPPPCLDNDPFTKPGLAQLHTMAKEKRLTVQMIYSAHSSAQHFTDVISQSGSILSSAAMAAIETEWSPLTKEQLSSGSVIPEPILAYFQEFRNPEREWLIEQGKTILPCEILYDGSTKLGIALAEMMDTWSSPKKRVDKERFRILYTSFQTTRQWIFYAHLGYWLAQLDKNGNLPATPIKVPFILGYGHLGTERKLTDYFGIPVEVFLTQHQNIDYSVPHEVARRKAFASATAMARMTNEQIATLVAYS